MGALFSALRGDDAATARTTTTEVDAVTTPAALLDPEESTRWWVTIQGGPFTRQEIRDQQRVLTNFGAPCINSIYEPVSGDTYCIVGPDDSRDYMLREQTLLEQMLHHRVSIAEANGMKHV